MTARRWLLSCACALLAVPLWLAALGAQDPPPAYLAGMPEPARVIGDIRGSDSLDTFARQRSYWSDERFRREVLDRYVPASARTLYVENFRERVAQNRQLADAERSDSAAREPPVRVAARAVRDAPVPADQRRFALAVHDWCRRFQAPEQENPIAREQFQREAQRQAAAISRSVGLVQGWSGILVGINAYDRTFRTAGEDASAADLVVSVDTAARVHRTPPAAFKATVGSSSPIYAAAGRMREGQKVVFSGRALQFDNWIAGGEPVQCTATFKIVLTDLRPAP